MKVKILKENAGKEGHYHWDSVAKVAFHPERWGLGFAFGKKKQDDLGLSDNYDKFVRVVFLCFGFEYVKSVFFDEDGLIGEESRSLFDG